MSRALSLAVLPVLAMITAVVPVHADPRGRIPLRSYPIVVPPPKPIAAKASHVRHDRVFHAPAGRFVTEEVLRFDQPSVDLIREEPPRRLVRMRSGAPIDVGAIVGPRPGMLFAPPPTPAEALPYAPPEFYMIGTPSTRHMGSPVKLTYGVKPPETLKTGPKVVWLNEAGESADDAGGRVKRLR